MNESIEQIHNVRQILSVIGWTIAGSFFLAVLLGLPYVLGSFAE